MLSLMSRDQVTTKQMRSKDTKYLSTRFLLYFFDLGSVRSFVRKHRALPASPALLCIRKRQVQMSFPHATSREGLLVCDDHFTSLCDRPIC